MNSMEDRRQAAIKRLQAKRDFRNHLAIFLTVNTMLVVIWAATGAGYFWPIWPIGGWLIGLLAHASSVYFDRPPTERQIQAEMDRDQPQDTLGR